MHVFAADKGAVIVDVDTFIPISTHYGDTVAGSDAADIDFIAGCDGRIAICRRYRAFQFNVLACFKV